MFPRDSGKPAHRRDPSLLTRGGALARPPVPCSHMANKQNHTAPSVAHKVSARLAEPRSGAGGDNGVQGKECSRREGVARGRCRRPVHTPFAAQTARTLREHTRPLHRLPPLGPFPFRFLSTSHPTPLLFRHQPRPIVPGFHTRSKTRTRHTPGGIQGKKPSS